MSPVPLSKSLELASVKSCKTWKDESGTGGYVVNLDVIRPEDSEFD
jgi:hypothetical protein